MSEIRAFVGHSFTEDDSELVLRFLRIFDQIKTSVPTFSWVHAEPAQPLDLAVKVMSLMQDKNLFIAICTIKEHAISKSALKPSPFPQFLFGRRDQFAYKTSDWITQEIGLALGKGMDLVLLYEKGLRPPGGLQGNREYIEFDRRDPEATFRKLLEMISSLRPKDGSQAVVAPERTLTEQEQVEANVEAGPDASMVPQVDWKEEDFRRAYMRFVIKQDTAGAQAINLAYRSSAFGADPNRVAEWEAEAEYFEILFNDHGDIARLRELASSHPSNPAILSALAGSLVMFSDHSEAAEIYQQLGESSSVLTDKTDYLGRAAIQFARASQIDLSNLCLDKLKSLLTNPNPSLEIQILTTIREVSEITNNHVVSLSAMERIVELNPADITTRSSLAYNHSLHDGDDLALWHYLRIPESERSSMNWNNLGVAFDHFKINGKAVDAYKRSEVLGETLATANLAQTLMSIGFFEEARERLSEAAKLQDHHKNIDLKISTLRSAPDAEDEKEKELLAKSGGKRKFWRKLGQAISRPDAVSIDGQWKGKQCPLQFTVNGKSVRAVGTYDQTNSPLARSLSRSNTSDQFEIVYDLKLSGGVLEGTVQRQNTDPTKRSSALSILGSDSKTKVLMLVSTDGQIIEVLENAGGALPTFYTLTRLAS